MTPKEFIDAWNAEFKANGTVDGVAKRLGNKMTKAAAVARAASYRKQNVDLAKFPTSRSIDWAELRKYARGGATNGHKAKTSKPKTKAK